MICRRCKHEHPGTQHCSVAQRLRERSAISAKASADLDGTLGRLITETEAERQAGNAQPQHVAQPPAATPAHVAQPTEHVAQPPSDQQHVARGNAGRCRDYRERNAEQVKTANKERMRIARRIEREALKGQPNAPDTKTAP